MCCYLFCIRGVPSARAEVLAICEWFKVERKSVDLLYPKWSTLFMFQLAPGSMGKWRACRYGSKLSCEGSMIHSKGKMTRCYMNECCVIDVGQLASYLFQTQTCYLFMQGQGNRSKTSSNRKVYISVMTSEWWFPNFKATEAFEPIGKPMSHQWVGWKSQEYEFSFDFLTAWYAENWINEGAH